MQAKFGRTLDPLHVAGGADVVCPEPDEDHHAGEHRQHDPVVDDADHHQRGQREDEPLPEVQAGVGEELVQVAQVLGEAVQDLKQ